MLTTSILTLGYGQAQNGVESRQKTQLEVIPALAVAGSELTVRFEKGSTGGVGWITLAAAGSAPETYISKVAARGQRGELSIQLPDVGGQVEVRYYDQSPDEGASVRTRVSVNLQAAVATLSAGSTASPGDLLSVSWSGPNNEGDFIALAEIGDSPMAFISFFYTQNALSTSLLVPDEPGTYEVRYVTGQSYRILASAPLEVQAANEAEATSLCGAPPDETNLEAAFDREVESFLAGARLAYGHSYDNFNYSYTASPALTGSDSGFVSATYSASGNDEETGELMNSSGFVEARFVWQNCTWSMTGFSY